MTRSLLMLTPTFIYLVCASFLPGKRVMEVFSICCATVLMCVVVVQLVRYFEPADILRVPVNIGQWHTIIFTLCMPSQLLEVTCDDFLSCSARNADSWLSLWLGALGCRQLGVSGAASCGQGQHSEYCLEIQAIYLPLLQSLELRIH